jgi:hypothetical protein
MRSLLFLFLVCLSLAAQGPPAHKDTVFYQDRFALAHGAGTLAHLGRCCIY